MIHPEPRPATRPGVRADIQMIAAPARAPGLSRSPRAASPASLPSALVLTVARIRLGIKGSYFCGQECFKSNCKLIVQTQPVY